MKEHELEAFEKELRGIAPSQPPAEFMARLAQAEPKDTTPQPVRPAVSPTLVGWWHLLRWLAPATALVVAVGLLWLKIGSRTAAPASPAMASDPGAFKADSVRLDEQLVGSFYAVARMPNGEPVRFRCRQWMDNLTVRDKGQGLVIEKRTPRVEVVPVRFETY